MNILKNIVFFVGGVGGVKVVKGLYYFIYKEVLMVIGNVGDDDNFYNFWVFFDLDILVYILVNDVNFVIGWGINNDSCRIFIWLV